jgi:hypothetical protein
LFSCTKVVVAVGFNLVLEQPLTFLPTLPFFTNAAWFAEKNAISVFRSDASFSVPQSEYGFDRNHVEEALLTAMETEDVVRGRGEQFHRLSSRTRRVETVHHSKGDLRPHPLLNGALLAAKWFDKPGQVLLQCLEHKCASFKTSISGD